MWSFQRMVGWEGRWQCVFRAPSLLKWRRMGKIPGLGRWNIRWGCHGYIKAGLWSISLKGSDFGWFIVVTNNFPSTSRPTRSLCYEAKAQIVSGWGLSWGVCSAVLPHSFCCNGTDRSGCNSRLRQWQIRDTSVVSFFLPPQNRQACLRTVFCRTSARSPRSSEKNLSPSL